MVRWVMGMILHGGPIRLFHVPASGMMHIKEPLLLIRKKAHVAAAGFLSRYLNGPLPYV